MDERVPALSHPHTTRARPGNERPRRIRRGRSAAITETLGQSAWGVSRSRQDPQTSDVDGEAITIDYQDRRKTRTRVGFTTGK